MKHNIFCIYDSAAAAYLPIFMMHRDEMAKRAFGDCVNRKDHAFCQHPDQYTLFRVGEFFDSDAKIVPCAPVSLGNGLEYKTLFDPSGYIVEESDLKSGGTE